MAKELSKVYEPQEVESRIYEMWQKGGYFHAEHTRSRVPFTIVMPPPNVTGQLHMGHAMDAALQDVLIRFKRMEGYSALCCPVWTMPVSLPRSRWTEELRKEGLTAMIWAARSSWRRSGTGSTSMATALWSSRKSWAPPAIGTGPVHHG